MIELVDLTVQMGDASLSGISLQLEPGEYCVLMGKTGCGKTSLLETICGLRRPASGRVMIDQTDVTDWPPGDRQIGYVPQDLALFPTHTVRQHLEFALRLRGEPGKQIFDRVSELSEVLGIRSLLARYPKGLSGGESQRVALGRALAFRPTVLLLDEPLSALDETTRDEMQTLLRHVQQTTGVTTLHVTHNVQEATFLAGRCIQLEDMMFRDEPK